MHEPSEEEIDAEIGRLVSEGALEVFFDADGSVSYRYTEKCLEVAPELYKRFLRTLEDELIDLIEAGYVTYRLADDLTPVFELTEEGRAAAEEIITRNSEE